MSITDGAFAIAVAMGVSGLMIDGVVSIVPDPQTSSLFEVHSIEAARHGDTASLWVDRTIHSPLHMAFSVRVMEGGPSGWREACSMQSVPILYMPDAILDQPVTLDWWTHGKCPKVPEGPARIVTTWAPTGRGLQPVTYTVEIDG